MISSPLRTLGLCALIVPAVCAHAWQQGQPSRPTWQQVCSAATAHPLTEQTPAGPLQGAELQQCDETALYYGQGAKPNDAAALQCGWWQHAHPQHTVGNMFYGPGVLSMLYANGRGVPRDYDLALRFACENEWAAPAETEGRVDHLQKLKALSSHETPPNFDLCDDATSGLSMGFCTKVQTSAADATRNTALQALVGKLAPAARSAFPALQSAESAFEEARSRNEIDLSGTGRAAFSLEEEAKLADQFAINLQRFSQAKIPATSPAQASALEAQLNNTYRQLQGGTWPQGVTIDSTGVRDTERAWIALADAWIRFSGIAFPGLSPLGVRAQLVRLRLHQLRSLQTMQGN